MNTQSILKVVVVAGLIGMTSASLATEGSWTRKADMPTARSGLAACVVDGKIYAIGGGPGNYGVTSKVEQYDPATDTWTEKASMQTPRFVFAAGVVNEKIYAVGGYGYLSSLEEYDPVADIWTTRAPMPTAREFLSTGAVNGKIYAIGGKISSSTVCIPNVEEYDPASDTWTRKADMPSGRGAMSCSTVDGVIYVVGGTYTAGTGLAGQAVPTVEAYDPATDTWTTKASMSTARCFFSTCVVNGRIYAIGGCANPYNSSELSSMEAYDPATDTWTKMPDMQVRRKALACAAVNGKIYAIGGVSGAGWDPPLSTVEEYEPVPPPPDFNGDFKIDIEDLIILIEHWGQDEPSVDIAPPPSGDGIVDAQDLEVFMSYWGQELFDPRLIAHWALDETEGDIAYDSVGVYDGVLNGVPTWQPTGGMVAGALQFDGINDYVSTPYVLNPADGEFSVFAWLKGSAPGQVAVSQAGGADWLLADPSEGKLVTGLMPPPIGRFPPQPLGSEFVITDGVWHRIGFVWDGTQRILYVDDAEVATDVTALGALQSADGGLYIGAGNSLGPSSFWSGLIDDVRIYNRAVTP